MLSEPGPSLATIIPVDRRFAGSTLGLWSMLRYSISIFVFSSGWCWMSLGGLYLSIDSPFSTSLGTGVMLISLAWLASVIILALTYPEWPHNDELCKRLRQTLQRRDPAQRDEFFSRVVELVPRERWNRVRLETATDLMTIEVDQRGVRMKGDRFDYELPRESILGTEVESVTPSGWLCRSHMVVLIVRTCDGTVELPVAYRDFAFGSLRSSRRKSQSVELASLIARIAAGECNDLSHPAAAEDAIAFSENPYASPAVLNDRRS